MDAVNVRIMWNRVIAITNEVVRTLVRTSFSTNVRESLDPSVMVFDAQARSIAQGDYSATAFVGTGPPTVRHMLAKFPAETLRPAVGIRPARAANTASTTRRSIPRDAIRYGRTMSSP